MISGSQLHVSVHMRNHHHNVYPPTSHHDRPPAVSLLDSVSAKFCTMQCPAFPESHVCTPVTVSQTYIWRLPNEFLVRLLKYVSRTVQEPGPWEPFETQVCEECSTKEWLSNDGLVFEHEHGHDRFSYSQLKSLALVCRRFLLIAQSLLLYELNSNPMPQAPVPVSHSRNFVNYCKKSLR